jgi:hypothetical protein
VSPPPTSDLLLQLLLHPHPPSGQGFTGVITLLGLLAPRPEVCVRPKSTEIDKGISHRQHRFVQEKKPEEESPARELEPAAAHRLGVL